MPTRIHSVDGVLFQEGTATGMQDVGQLHVWEVNVSSSSYKGGAGSRLVNTLDPMSTPTMLGLSESRGARARGIKCI